MQPYKVQQYKCRLVKDGAVRFVPRCRVPCSDEAVELFRTVMQDLPHEEVWIATLSGAHDVRGLVRVGQGGLHGAALRPVDILRPVVVSGEGSFILAHNHPSGDPTPSDADREMTRHLIQASEVLGIYCLDHLIITRGERWVSLRETGEFAE